MTKTQHYQLNQWDPEDRILRVDFNSDNAAIDAALKASTDAIAAETSARTSADTKIRTDFAAADNTVRSEFAAADNAVRSEFAAADAALRSENLMVKLLTHTTTANATQIDVSVKNIDLTQYAEIIILPQLKTNTVSKTMTFRINGLTSGYYHGTSAENYFASFYPTSGYHGTFGSYYAKLILYPGGENLSLWNSLDSKNVRLPASKLTASAVTTLNFLSSDATILAGSKIIIYGVKL